MITLALSGCYALIFPLIIFWILCVWDPKTEEDDILLSGSNSIRQLALWCSDIGYDGVCTHYTTGVIVFSKKSNYILQPAPETHFMWLSRDQIGTSTLFIECKIVYVVKLPAQPDLLKYECSL